MFSLLTKNNHYRVSTTSTCLLLSLIAYLCLVCFTQQVHAGVVTSGDVDPSDPTSWTQNTTAYIGKIDSGTLNITESDVVINDDSHIGYGSRSTGEVLVDGTDSIWENNSALNVGYYGNGTLKVTNGGAVNNGNYALLGFHPGSRGEGTVDGASSTWMNNGQFFVGYSGNGTLNIINGGGIVSNAECYIGYESGSSGKITVDGVDSTWTNRGFLYVGNNGRGTLNIINGSTVTVEENTLVARNPGSSGAIHFDNGTLTTGGFGIAVDDLTGTGTVNTHGLVSDVDLVFDATHGLNQIISINKNINQNITINLNVNGLGSMGAGYGGVGTTNISDGRVIESTFGYIGYKPGSLGEVNVNGIGSTWMNNILRVGNEGHGRLNIISGGVVSNGEGYIGLFSSSIGEVRVDGIGSAWSNSYFYVGQFGSGTLNITNGGAVSCRWGYIGYVAGSTGVITVDGTDSSFTNSFNIDIGRAGHGTLNITNGGSVSSKESYIGHEPGSTGIVTVDGSGSNWTSRGFLYIGDSGHGTLIISNGGNVNNAHSYIGHITGTMGLVTVDGIGSTWKNRGRLYVGTYGSGSRSARVNGYKGIATLNITGGGLVIVGQTLTIDNYGIGNSFINMGSGGMLALYGDAGDSLVDFLDLVKGTDAIRYWDDSISDWADITSAIDGVDYTLSYQTEGDLAGYTVLTVIPEPATLLLLGFSGSLAMRRRQV